RQELSALPDYWKDAPLDPSWVVPAEGLRKEIEEAEGLFTERFALCQALPLERVQAVTEGLRKVGYRPVRVRPGSPRVAIVWTRDGRDWKLEMGLTAEAVKERDAHWKKDGFIPAD